MSPRKGSPRVVVVTGAGRGVGRHLTEALLERGDAVTAVDLDLSELEELAAAHPDRLLLQRADVTVQADVDATAAVTLERWGHIDVLVNNASPAPSAPFATRTPDELLDEPDSDVVGYVRMIAAVLPAMRDMGKGVIHNVVSGVGLAGFPDLAGFTASKGAIEALTRTLAAQLAPSGITVNTVRPALSMSLITRPLSMSRQAMASPVTVARRLATKIGSTSPIVLPDLSGASAALSRLAPRRSRRSARRRSRREEA